MNMTIESVAGAAFWKVVVFARPAVFVVGVSCFAVVACALGYFAVPLVHGSAVSTEHTAVTQEAPSVSATPQLREAPRRRPRWS